MATPRKGTAAKVDPLTEELPPIPEEKPADSDDVKFEVQISAYVWEGRTYYRWEILENNHIGYVGDYSGHKEASFGDAKDAENAAKFYIERIRHAVHLKLNSPESYRITL